MLRRKDISLIYICGMIFFSKEKLYKKLYINIENLVFSKFQNKITGKLCGLGKSCRQHHVKHTNPLQNMLKF